jgi:hypothetical protein
MDATEIAALDARGLCTELDQERLKHDWTWDQLAGQMRVAGLPMSARTLHYLLKHHDSDRRPHDRTVYKVRRFLLYLARTTAVASSAA